MLSRKKRRKQERQERKARRHDRYRKLRGLSVTEQSRIVTEERKRPEIPPAKRKRPLISKKQTQGKAVVEDKGIEKEKRELKKLEKLLLIKERKEEKQKKLPNAFIRDGLDYVLDFARYTNSESDNDISSIEGEEEEEELPSEEEDYQSSTEEETEEIVKEDISLGESSEGDEDVQKKKKVTFAPDTFATQKPSTSSSIPTSPSSPNVNKRIQGLMNKLNESNIQTMFTSMEELYRENSQREVTKCFCEVFLKSVIQPILIKDKFAMELVMLVTLLHQKIGSEVGFAVLSQLVKKLNELLSSPSYGKGKECDCLLLVISHLYNFKVVQCVLIYDIIRKLLDSLTERDLDLLVLILKTCGMEIRRNDSLALKDIILDIQTKARTLNEDNSRMKFLLQVVSAIRTNNVRKIPQHDPTLLEHMKKVLRGLLSGSLNESQAINLSFSELLEASGKGGYWNTTKSLTDLSLTNSGSTPSGSGPAPVVDDGKDDKWIVSLSLEQQMNTDIRRTVFSVIMSSEDYVDAFEKLVKLRLKSIQEREIVFVIVHCSLQENPFNPFYGYLSQKLIKYKRDHQVTFQYCLWDHLKTLSSLTSTQRLNLQCLLSHLIRDRSLSLSVLRVVEYAGMSKVEVEFHKSLLVMIFSGLSDQQLTNFVCSMGENRKDFVKNLYHFVRKQSQEKNTKTSQNIFKRLEELLIETIEY